MLAFTTAAPPPGRPQYRTRTVLAQLHARPGEWAHIEGMAMGSAHSLSQRLLAACSAVEIEIRYVGKLATLWMRIGPGTPDDDAAPPMRRPSRPFFAYHVQVA